MNPINPALLEIYGHSGISNCRGEAKTKRIDPEEVVVFRGSEGSAYNHHPDLVSLNGRLFASWDCAPRDEDSVGQHMRIAFSDDNGDSWSESRPLVPPFAESGELAVGTAMGIHVHAGGLTAYQGYYRYSAETAAAHGLNGNGIIHQGKGRQYLDTHTRIYTSSDGGDTWREAGQRIPLFVPNHPPVVTSSGRLVMCGNISFPYTDDPRGVDGWTKTGLPRLPEGYEDSPEGFWYVNEARRDELAFCEASLLENADGTFFAFLRITDKLFREGRTIPASQPWPGRLCVSVSRDRGRTYSEPMLTDYTDCSNRHSFGRLPDGRYYGLNTPDPAGKRTPLVLATSIDGLRFDTHYLLGDARARQPRMEGHAKGGRYGYPVGRVANGYFHAIYSASKEDIVTIKVPLDRLD